MKHNLQHPLASRLIEIECELRRAGFWHGESPPPAALASTEPFCIDTLTFEQWLQFILLPRMHQLLDSGSPLPAQCDIATMAETVWGNQRAALPVIQALRAFDQTLTGST